MAAKMLRFPELRERIGLSRATIDRLERDGRFPARRRIGVRSVAWVEQEVESWIQSKQKEPRVVKKN